MRKDLTNGVISTSTLVASVCLILRMHHMNTIGQAGGPWGIVEA